jgi:long-chain fatty acid transport protein
MARNILKISALAFLASASVMSAAQAGGFARGTADTDIIYEEGNFNIRAGATIVVPNRAYATINGAPATDSSFAKAYVIPSAAVKLNINEDLRCAGTFTQSNGASSEYGPQAIAAGKLTGASGTVSTNFTTNEAGLTCGYKINAGKGQFWLLGGVYAEAFDYAEVVEFGPFAGPLNGSRATLAFDGEYKLGYRLGAAYEIPEYALRAQLMYRSAVTHTPDGSFTFLGGTLPAVGLGTLPQSVELKLQSGVAPGWLVFGSVKWTDWSVLDTLDYTIAGPGPIGGDKIKEFYFRDGWTVSGGVGHAFTENVSGALSLTWDRGTSTTEDHLTDSYTLAGGVSLKDKLGGELRFGGGVSYLTSGSVALNPASPGAGASFASTVDGDWAYALSASYKTKW